MASQSSRTRNSTKHSLLRSRTSSKPAYRSESVHKSTNSASHQARLRMGENQMRARPKLNRIALRRCKPRRSTRTTGAKSSIITNSKCSRRPICYHRTTRLLLKSLERTNSSPRSPQTSKTSAAASSPVKRKPTGRWPLGMESPRR